MLNILGLFFLGGIHDIHFKLQTITPRTIVSASGCTHDTNLAKHNGEKNQASEYDLELNNNLTSSSLTGRMQNRL